MVTDRTHRTTARAARALLVLALAAFAGPVLARPRSAQPCPDGTFAIAGRPLANAQGVDAGYRVALAQSQVSIGGVCDTPAAATVRTRRKRTVIRAEWAGCRGVPGKVVMVAKLRAGSCDTMRGVLRRRKGKHRSQRFRAKRAAAVPAFSPPTTCAGCHPRQYREWQGSMMAYAAVSPVANALEAAGNRLLHGAFAPDGSSPLFCQKCHAPASAALGEFPTFAASGGRPSRDFAGATGIHGVSCDVCHQTAHADLAGSLSGDGIANAAFVMRTGSLKFGPFSAPMRNPTHDATPSGYLRSSDFCGACHDVRIVGDDTLTAEPFRRLENLFTEWQQGPYATTANPYGKVVTCQDCHMSAYPYAPPGTYFTDQVAIVSGAPDRQVSSHYFTGPDVALADFPGQDDAGLDAHGLPTGQRQRRDDLLRAACTMRLELPAAASAGTLPVTVAVTNTGAGHNVPSGFSQERQMWIELTVTDADGTVVYRTGHLVDSAHPETGELVPDGSLDDEDLGDWVGTMDPVTLEADLLPGPDPDLVDFHNKFLRAGAGGTEEVLAPFLATAMDNTGAIPPLATVRGRWDVPVPAGVHGPLRVTAQLRFRAFPPRFLRALAGARPDLVDEALVDRNRIVDMAAAQASVPVD
jgi:Cytochrome c554 and c-prime